MATYTITTRYTVTASRAYNLNPHLRDALAAIANNRISMTFSREGQGRGRELLWEVQNVRYEDTALVEARVPTLTALEAGFLAGFFEARGVPVRITK